MKKEPHSWASQIKNRTWLEIIFYQVIKMINQMTTQDHFTNLSHGIIWEIERHRIRKKPIKLKTTESHL